MHDEVKISKSMDKIESIMASEFWGIGAEKRDIITEKERRKNEIYQLVEKTGMVPQVYAKYMSRKFAYNNYGNSNEAACNYIINQYKIDFLDMIKEERENNGKGKKKK